VSAKGFLEKSTASTTPKLVFGLFLHPRHQFITVHTFGKAGEIFHDARGGEQTAGLFAGEHERRKLRARGVKRGGPTRRTGTDDDNFFHRRES